jgi:FdhD protein
MNERDPGAASAELVAVRGATAASRTDHVAVEEPLEIRVEGPDRAEVRVAVTMRTPGHDLELAAGFLRTEALIRDRDDLAARPAKDLQVVTGRGNVLTLRVRVPFDRARLERNFYATSSCGVCGKAALELVAVAAPPLAPGPVVPRETLLGLPAALRAAQGLFEQTGGLHATGLFDTAGNLLVAREDVGRHNAMDKVVGWALLRRALPLSERVFMVSGRASFELVQKAAMAGVSVLCAVSAPSSLAVATAQRLGMTLVGFLRGDGFNVYAHPARIDLGASDP